MPLYSRTAWQQPDLLNGSKSRECDGNGTTAFYRIHKEAISSSVEISPDFSKTVEMSQWMCQTPDDSEDDFEIIPRPLPQKV